MNDDGEISPVDALIVINWLNAKGETAPPDGPPYRDTSGDGYVAPVDALLVINHLMESMGDPPPALPDVPVLVSPWTERPWVPRR